MDTKLKENLLKLLLFLSAIYHLIIGTLGLFFTNFSTAIASYAFNFNLVLTDQVKWILKPFATYMLIFGILLLIAAWKPQENRTIIWALVGFAIFRAIQRIYFLLTADQALFSKLNMTGSIINIFVLIGLGISVYFLEKNLSK